MQEGYAIATRTYERIGAPYVGNRLHCQSCHLDAGGNPDASWWVDMEQDYQGREGLQGRIDACFQHSMDGKPLCTPGPDCDSDPRMSGLVAYMGWLTDRCRAAHRGATPARGFPNEDSPDFKTRGDPRSGARIYTQKCAFCHGTQGQGRCLGGYFRPALWGPDSYRADAGMHGNPTLAAFLHANMPYTSGGLLGLAEARDLAAYINGQCRPGLAQDLAGRACTGAGAPSP